MNERGGKWNRYSDYGRSKKPNHDDEDDYGGDLDHDEDDDLNDIGGDIDANNFETFDNAAEWNEDEHEDLIAQDNILSRQILEVNDLEKQILKMRTRPDPPVSSSDSQVPWNPFGGQDFFKPTDPASSQILQQFMANDQSLFLHAPQSLANLELEQIQQQLRQQSQHQAMLLMQQQKLLRQQQQQQEELLNNPITKLQMLQHQQRILQQQEALLRQQQQQHQLQLQQEQLRIDNPATQKSPKVFTVEELERQMVASSRSNESQVQNQMHRQRLKSPPVPIREPSREVFTQPDRQFKPLQPKGQHPSHVQDSETQLCLFAAIQLEQEQQQRQQQQQQQQQNHLRGQRKPESHENRFANNSYDRDRMNNQNQNHNQHYSNNNKNTHHRDSRDNRKQHNRRRYTVLPPQVQLSVLESAKGLHSINTKYPDEFIQDRRPNNGGFFFKRSNEISLDENSIYNGILTEDERKWLTSIQKKIQSDYDENLEQDYYYMLYFNQSKPEETKEEDVICTPSAINLISSGDSLSGTNGIGHQDRRFVARERLLYNNN